MVAGFGGGAFIFNQVQTAFINPDNLKPGHEENGDKWVDADIENLLTNCCQVWGHL